MWQPGLSVCRPPGSIPTQGRGAPSKPLPLAPIAGAANPLSDAKLQPLSRVPSQKNNVKSTNQAGSKLHPPPSFPRSPAAAAPAQPLAWSIAGPGTGYLPQPNGEEVLLPRDAQALDLAPCSAALAVLSHRLSCPCTQGTDGQAQRGLQSG